jgi:hypothetical protein
MDATAEAAALMKEVDGPRWTSGAVPKDLAPLLRALADMAAQRGKGLTFDRLQAVVQEKTGERKGRSVLHRWIRESGGEPWFKSQ